MLHVIECRKYKRMFREISAKTKLILIEKEVLGNGQKQIKKVKFVTSI